MTDQSVHPEAASAYGGKFGPWKWDEPKHAEHFRRCSWCGSINPEDLAAETDWRAGWADMKYGWPHKFYVDIVNREPDTLFVMSAINFEPRENERDKWIAVADLTDEQREVVRRDGWERDDGSFRHTYYQFMKHPHHWGKFYTIHLKDSELDSEVKDTIERKSGLTFEFSDGRVTWQKYPYPPMETISSD
jgi:hypothetical protein